jgi:hypothetical protein
MELVDVEMDNVEFINQFSNLIQHNQVIRDYILNGCRESERCSCTSYELCRSRRVAACKQGNIMTRADELFGEIRDNPLCPSIIGGRHAFNGGSDLCDPH